MGNIQTFTREMYQYLHRWKMSPATYSHTVLYLNLSFLCTLSYVMQQILLNFLFMGNILQKLNITRQFWAKSLTLYLCAKFCIHAQVCSKENYLFCRNAQFCAKLASYWCKNDAKFGAIKSISCKMQNCCARESAVSRKPYKQVNPDLAINLTG